MASSATAQTPRGLTVSRVARAASYISISLPLVIALSLLIPSVLPYGVFRCERSENTVSLGGIGYTADGQQAIHPPSFNYFSSKNPPDLLAPLPRLLFVQFVFSLVHLTYAIINAVVFIVRPFKSKAVSTIASSTSGIAARSSALSTILLTFGMLSADLGVLYHTRDAVRGIGNLSLEPAGHWMVWGSGGLTSVWLVSWLIVSFSDWSRRTEEKRLRDAEEADFMPQKPEYVGERD